MDKNTIAITGMSCMFPGARDLDSYWQNILAGKSAIKPIPPSRNVISNIQDPDTLDEIFCKEGGFLDDEIPFSPLDFGIMPSICEDSDPEQLLALQMTDLALKDSGIDPRKEDLSDSEVIVGRGGYLGSFLQQGFQKIEVLPQVIDVIDQLIPGISQQKLSGIKNELRSCFAHLNTDRVSLAVPNVTTGRIANKYNMLGANYTIDAACASALVAMEHAVMSLRQGKCNRVITGGIHLAHNPSIWWLFSRLEALSRKNAIRPFSKEADGMLAGEGIGMLVLERLEDAVKAGRRVYAVVRGVGTSSDGRGAGLLAPRKEGQLKALERAYRDADVDPQTIDLVEGHGTATKVGDQVELDTINSFFGKSPSGVPTRALGSVKSMIGHAMPASGAASLIKTTLSVHHKILPPTLCEGDPAEGMKNSSFYLNTQTRPWVHPPDKKRRAGVNAFGFGGINGHVVLEESESTGMNLDDIPITWSKELFLATGQDWVQLKADLQALKDNTSSYVSQEKPLGLYSLDVCERKHPRQAFRLAIVAGSYEDLNSKIDQAIQHLDACQGQESLEKNDIFYQTNPLSKSGKVVFIFPGNAFPGLGDDYAEHLAELSVHLPFFRLWFDLLEIEKPMPDKPYRYSTLLFSPPKIPHELFVELKKELRVLDNSASGVFIANTAGFDLMSRLGMAPDMVTGTSLGEWSAVVASGMVSLDQIAALDVHAEGQEIEEIKGAIGLSQHPMEKLQPYFDEFNRDKVTVTCSMDLSPQQVVFGGTREKVDEFCKVLNDAGIWAKYLNLFPIHTPACQPIADLVYKKLDGLKVSKPTIPAYSAAIADQFPTDPEKLRTLLADNPVLPVYMRPLFEKLHDDGARIFVQLGGGGKISTPISETLEGKPHTILTLDASNRDPIHQLQHVVGSLYAHHANVKLNILFDSRRKYLKRCEERCEKVSKYTVLLRPAKPKFEIKDESLKIEMEGPTSVPTSTASVASLHPVKNNTAPSVQASAHRSGTTHFQAPSSTAASSTIQAVANDPQKEQIEEFLSEQLDTMTRIYAMQKNEEITDNHHFLNMMKYQAQLASVSPDAAMAAETDQELPQSQPQAATLVQPQALPFIGNILEHVPQQKLVFQRTLSLQHDAFLQDHAFVPCPAEVKSPAERVPTLPMAVALEIMSEAAKTLYPEATVCGLQNINNKKWINFDEQLTERDIVVTAEVTDPADSGELVVNVSVRASEEKQPRITGQVLIAGGHYAGNQVPFDTDLGQQHISLPLDPKSLYRAGGLYHGPFFQGVESLTSVTAKGVNATITTPQQHGFFANQSSDSLLVPSQLIDCASHLICSYDIATEQKNTWVAPISIERIWLFSAPPAAGTRVDATFIMTHCDNSFAQFNVALSVNGQLIAAIQGWRDWRMKWSTALLEAWQNPTTHLLASKYNSIQGADSLYTLYTVNPKDLHGIDPDWLARFYLNQAEYNAWSVLSGKAQRDNLMSFIAMKDAIRGLLSSRNIAVYPAQIRALGSISEQVNIKIDDQRVSQSVPFSAAIVTKDGLFSAIAVSEPIDNLTAIATDYLERI